MIALCKVLFILGTLSFAIALFMKKNIVETVPVSIMGIVAVLYICGFLGNLKIGYYIILVIVLIAFLYIVFMSVKKKTGIFQYFSLSIIIYGLFTLWVYMLNNGRMFCEWDEFTHWGFTVKIMYDSNKFSNELGSTLYFVDYLPGTALFQYFVLQCLGKFNEGFISIAQGLLVGSFMIPVCNKKIRNIKDIFQNAFAFFILFTIPIGFYSSVYSSVYVDAALGFVFAYILYNHFSTQSRDVFFYITMSLAFSFLCIIKPSGIGLMALLSAVLLCDNIYNKRYVFSDKKQFAIRGFLDFIPVIIGFLFKKAWALRLDRLGYSAHFDTGKITIKKLLNVLQGKGEEYQTETLNNFRNAFVGIDARHIAGNALIMYVLLFLAMAVILYLIKNEKKYIVLGVISSAVYLVYSIYMLCLYLFSYSQGEAVALASFNRYEYTIIMGVLMGMMMIFLAVRLDTIRFSKLFLVYTLILFIIPGQVTYWINNQDNIQNSIDFRAKYQYGEKINKKLSSKDKVYIISQDSDGLDYFILRYTLSPVHTQVRRDDQSWNDVSFSIGQLRGENDGTRRVISAEEWMQYLLDEEFNYVFLYHIDEQFISEFGGLFDSKKIEDNQLYVLDREKRILVKKKLK